MLGLRIVQEVVRLIEQDPVWQASPAAHLVDGRQRRPDVRDLLILRQSRQVDDDARRRIEAGGLASEAGEIRSAGGRPTADLTVRPS